MEHDHDSTGGPLTPEDWIKLDRYVAGEGSETEREEMRLRIQASPTLAAIVDVMRSSGRNSTHSPGAPDTAAAWHGISAKIGGRQRAPLALISSGSPRRDVFERSLVGIAAAILIVAGASLVFHRAHQGTSGVETPAIRAQYQTARGERANIELQDGTRVALAPETQLRIASTGRLVYLSGEAAFTVTHNPAQPFRVIANNGAEISDIGTQFDVRAYSVEHAVRVVVADGSVSLRALTRGPSAAPVILLRGSLGIADSTAVRVTPVASADQYLAWTQGRLTFTNARMAEVVVDLSRWFDLDVRLGSPSLADVRLTVALNDAPADVTLEVIARAINARVARAGQSATLYSKNGEARE